MFDHEGEGEDEFSSSVKLSRAVFIILFFNKQKGCIDYYSLANKILQHWLKLCSVSIILSYMKSRAFP